MAILLEACVPAFQGTHFEVRILADAVKSAHRVWLRFKFVSPKHKAPRSKERVGKYKLS